MPPSPSAPVAPPAVGSERGMIIDLPLRWVLIIVVFSRLLIAANWVWLQDFGLGDVPYYVDRAGMLADLGVGVTLREYPTPLAGLLFLPWLLGGGQEGAYLFWFVTLVLVADLALCVLLWRSGLPGRGWAIVVWSAVGALLGPLIWLRVDLFPAVLVGAGALLMVTRPAVAGVLLALGAGLKLWPGVLAGFLVDRNVLRRGSWRTPVLAFAGTGVLIVVLSVAAGGWDRLVSPLTWQSDRGLQIESVPATALMALHAGDPNTWAVQMSHYQAFELFGPGVAETLVVSDVLTLVGALVGVLVLVRSWLAPAADRFARTETVAIGMLAAISLLIVTNKTLSPQYVIWLAGPLAVLVALRGFRVRRTRRLVALVGLVAGLTHLVYPVWYGHLNGMDPHPVGTPLGTAALVARNLLLVVLTVVTVHASLFTNRPKERADTMPSGL
ncbi:glycosyltransferase 87 family protein [Ammonicoccus fulvus]|uniref:Glycosyltransferase 87 family protein n=1 Tax=Ammonicoccus fulvus TaxID=3138240 RepID=A0ABZ3FQF2_9ACTN